MVIEKILKQLTPERIKEEREKIQNIKLPPEIQKWVTEYEKVGDRDPFIWKWLYNADKKIIDFYGFPKKYLKLSLETTFILNIFIVLLDDVSEKHDYLLLKELSKIPFNDNPIKNNRWNDKQIMLLKFASKSWDRISKNIQEFPYYQKVKDTFNYDIYQLINNARYSSLIYSNPYLSNKTEYWIYAPQNMQLILTFDIYSMCVFAPHKGGRIGKIREIILCMQSMARIGNSLATWERELKTNDFASNGILLEGLKNVKKLKNDSNKRKFEQNLLKKWEFDRLITEKLINKIKDKQSKKFLLGIKFGIYKITLYYLLAKGKV